MGVLDSSILVGAAIARHKASVLTRVVEAAQIGLFDPVVSETILSETREVLCEDFGRPADQVDAYLTTIRSTSLVVPLSTDSPDLVKIVRGDAGDVHVIRTALGVIEHKRELAQRRIFLVSDNTKHFRPGQKVYGITFVTAHQFWRMLSEGDAGEA